MWQRFLILKDNKSQNALDKDSCKDVFQDFYCEIEKKVTVKNTELFSLIVVMITLLKILELLMTMSISFPFAKKER